jgi:hypothetical protein
MFKKIQATVAQAFGGVAPQLESLSTCELKHNLAHETVPLSFVSDLILLNDTEGSVGAPMTGGTTGKIPHKMKGL